MHAFSHPRLDPSGKLLADPVRVLWRRPWQRSSPGWRVYLHDGYSRRASQIETNVKSLLRVVVDTGKPKQQNRLVLPLVRDTFWAYIHLRNVTR